MYLSDVFAEVIPLRTNRPSGIFAGMNRDLALLCFTRAIISTTAGLVVPILPIYAESFGASFFIIGLIYGIYGVTMTIFQTPFGILSDRVGKRKPFILVGMFGFAGTTFLFAISQSYVDLLATRALQGFIAAMDVPAITAMIADLSPEEHRGNVMGIYSTSSTLGWAVTGPIFGGLIAQYYGIRMPFIVFAILSLFSAIILLVAVPDVKGLQPKKKKRSKATNGLQIDVFILSVAFGFAMLGIGLIIPLLALFIARLGASISEIGFAIAAFGLGNVLFQTPFGRLSDRIGRKPPIIFGMISLGVIIFWYPFITSLFYLVILRFLQGISFAAFMPATFALCTDLSRDRRGEAMGVLNTAFSLGLMVGPIAGGAIAEIYGLFLPFSICGILVLASSIPLFRVQETVALDE